MNRLYLMFILLSLTHSLNGQMTNKSEAYWSANYFSSFSNLASLTNSFYKFIVSYRGSYLDSDINRTNNMNNIFPGTVLNLTNFIYNVGNINEAIGINLKLGIIPTNIIVNLYTNNNLVTNTHPINSGGNLSYRARVTIPTNYSGNVFAFNITNTGSTNGPPFPHKVVTRHVINVVHQNVLIREATDGIHTITLFDGTQRLGNLNVKIYIQFQNTVIDPNSVKLYYDMNGIPDASTPDGSVTRNRIVSCIKEGNSWYALIPVTDPEVRDGNIVNFIISVDGRLYNNAGQPWRYVIKDYVEQEESKYTISLNNKFNPSQGESYKLIYKLNRQSFVNISVYNTRGELIVQLKNQVMEIGKHNIEWDGKNSFGKIVAMGLYLINVQTAEYGDTRKIVVIKR